MNAADRACWAELRRALLTALRAVEARLEAADEAPKEIATARR